MDVIIDPDWSFSEAFLVARQAYPGDGLGSKGYRNWVLKAWASTVGRERAVRGIGEFRANYPSKRAAAAALGLSADTFRRLEAHFAQVRSASRPGLTLFLSTRLLPWDQTMLHAYVCTVLGVDTDVRVAEYVEAGSGASARVRLVGDDSAELVRVAEYIAEVAWRTQQKAALQVAGLMRLPQVLDSLDTMRASVQRMELWERERRDSEGAVKDAATVRKRTWASEPLMAMAAEVAKATGAPGLVNAGLQLGGRAVEALEQARNEGEQRRLEAKLARRELDEE